MELIDQFDTKRLRVFHFQYIPPGGCEFDRDVFVGWLTQEEQTYPVVQAVCGFGLEMIWVHDFYRRQGLAREVVAELIARGHECHASGVSEAGKAFVEAMGLDIEQRPAVAAAGPLFGERE